MDNIKRDDLEKVDIYHIIAKNDVTVKSHVFWGLYSLVHGKTYIAKKYTCIKDPIFDTIEEIIINQDPLLDELLEKIICRSAGRKSIFKLMGFDERIEKYVREDASSVLVGFPESRYLALIHDVLVGDEICTMIRIWNLHSV